MLLGRPGYRWSSSQQPEYQGPTQTPGAYCVRARLPCCLQVAATLGSKQLVTKPEPGLHSLPTGFKIPPSLLLSMWPWATALTFLFVPPVLLFIPFPTLFSLGKLTYMQIMCSDKVYAQPMWSFGRISEGKKRVVGPGYLFSFCLPIVGFALIGCLCWSHSQYLSTLFKNSYSSVILSPHYCPVLCGSPTPLSCLCKYIIFYVVFFLKEKKMEDHHNKNLNYLT